MKEEIKRKGKIRRNLVGKIENIEEGRQSRRQREKCR